MQRRAGRLAAVGLAAGLLLTACGGAQPGVAALVEGEPLSVAAVQERTAAFFEAYPQYADVDPAIIEALSVENYIRSYIVNEAAADLGIEPTQGELDATIEELGGYEAVVEGVSRGGVPPDPELIAIEVRSYFLQFEIGREMAGPDANDEEVQLAINAAIDAKEAELDVEVNPRFGAWDGSRVIAENASISITEDEANGIVEDPANPAG